MAYKQELWDEAKRKCHIGDDFYATHVIIYNFLN